MTSLAYRTGSSKSYIYFIAIIILSALVGLLASIGSFKVDIIIIGLLFGLSFLVIPLELVFYSMSVLCFLIVGQLEYFAGIEKAKWMPILIGWGLYFRIPLDYLKSFRNHQAPPLRFPALIVPVYLFIAEFIISSAINLAPAMQIFIGFKLYLTYFSLLFILWINYTKIIKVVEWFWKNLRLVAIIQLPILLYQFFVIAPKRGNAGGSLGVAHDAMVGGFGGDPMGGGPGAALAYFMVLYFTLSLVLWKNKLVNLNSLVLSTLMVLLAISLAEVKIVIILMPIMMLLVYRNEAIRNPATLLLISLLMSGFVIGIIVIYSHIHVGIGASKDLAGMFDDAVGYSFKDALEPGRRTLSRFEAVRFWWNQNGVDDIVHTLFGYGPAASNGLSTVYVGELSRRYPFAIAISAATQLLWDMGLLGLFSYVGLLLLGAWRAFGLSKTTPKNSFSYTVLEVSGVGLLVMIILIPYGIEILDVAALQLLLMSMLAYIGVFDMLKHQKYKGDLKLWLN